MQRDRYSGIFGHDYDAREASPEPTHKCQSRGMRPRLRRGSPATRAKLVGADLPDVKLSLDSLGVTEEAMRHFYIKAMIEKSAGEHADWKAVDAAI